MSTSAKIDKRLIALADFITLNPGANRGDITKDFFPPEKKPSPSSIYRLLRDCVREQLIEKVGRTSAALYYPTRHRQLEHARSHFKHEPGTRPIVGYNVDWLESYEPNKTFLLKPDDLGRLQERCKPGCERRPESASIRR
jgi:hypothetical protein